MSSEMRSLLVALLLCLSTACFGSRADVGGGSGRDGGGSAADGGASGDGGAVECAGLDYCGCEEAGARCRVVSEDCFCPCGEVCVGDCVCDCGGGRYVGCAPAACEPVRCPASEFLVLGADGCPACAADPCAGRDFCDCWQDDRCGVQSDDCICHCDYFCPGEEPCDCDCGGGTYLGCQLLP